METESTLVVQNCSRTSSTNSSTASKFMTAGLTDADRCYPCAPFVRLAITESASAVNHVANSATSTPTKNVVRRINTKARKGKKLPPLVKDHSDSSSIEQDSPSIHCNANAIVQSNNAIVRTSLNPDQRCQQLEKNLNFVREHNQIVLKCLHNEIEDLKRINRDLQFQMIIGVLPQQPPVSADLRPPSTAPRDGAISKMETLIALPFVKAALPREVTEHIEKLEREIRRLRQALGETLRSNANLRTTIEAQQVVKSGRPGGVSIAWPEHGQTLSIIEIKSNSSSRQTTGQNSCQSSTKSNSPQFDEFTQTWREIQLSAAAGGRRASESTGQVTFLPPIGK